MIGKLKALITTHSPRQFAGYVVLVFVGCLSAFSAVNAGTTDLPWTFDANGGMVNGNPKVTDYTASSVIQYSTKNLILTHSDATLKCAGWYSKKDDTRRCGYGGMINGYFGGNFYAQWVVSKYPVILNSNFGSNQQEEITATKSIPTVLKSSFTRANHRLGGWSLEASAKAWKWANGESVVLDDYRDTEDHSRRDEYDDITPPAKLYAIWVKQFKISFDPNGGQGSKMTDLVLDENVPVNLPKSSYTPSVGYKFVGWKSDNGNGSYSEGDEVTYNSEKWAGTSDTFFAQWNSISYKVKFHENTKSPVIGSMSDFVISYDKWYALPKCAFNRFGYTFIGWATDPDGDVRFADTEPVQNLACEEGAVVELYAKWKPVNYVVRFDANGGDGSMGDLPCIYDQSYELPVNKFVRQGSDFLGWSKNSSNAVDYNDGATISNLTTVANSTNILRAVWSNIGYQISFDGNGGSGVVTNLDCKYGTVYHLPSNNFTRTGYVFTGWTTNASAPAVYAEGASVSNLTETADSIIPLFAAWRPIVYRLVFDANGGVGSLPPMTNSYDTVYTLPLNVITRIGKNFGGWSLTPTGAVCFADGAQVSNLTTEDDVEIILYASWGWAANSLNEALDNDKLMFVENSNTTAQVITDGSAKNGKCVRVAAADDSNIPRGITVVLEAPGELKFKWRVGQEDGPPHGWSVKYGDSQIDRDKYHSQDGMDDWQEAIVSSTNASTLVEIVLFWTQGSVDPPFPYLLLDDVRWSAGGNPEPEPSDAPVISAVASVDGDKFRVTFAADGRFRYELIKTDSLSPVNWQSFEPPLFLSPDADGAVSFEPELDGSKPNMFYRVRVLKKD